MKRIIYVLMFIMVFIMPVSANAKVEKPKGNLVTEYSVKDGLLKVKNEIEVSNEFETSDLKQAIKFGHENDEFNIDSIIVEDSNGKREIKAYNNNKDEDYYMLGKNKESSDLSIHFKDKIKVKKINLEYSYKKVISHVEKNSFDFFEVPVYMNFMGCNADEYKIRMTNDIKACWIKKGYDNYSENGDTKEIILNNKNNTSMSMANISSTSIVVAFDKTSEFISYEQVSLAKPDMDSIKKDSQWTNLFGEEILDLAKGDTLLGGIIVLLIVIIFFMIKSKNFRKLVLGGIACVISSVISKGKQRKGNGFSEGFKRGFNDTMEKGKGKSSHNKNEDSTFTMPSYINPAYLGILFDTAEEDIIFTILCELIRRGAIEIKVDEKYKNGADIHRKFILTLTDNNTKLESFEKTFIEKLREMDEIELINLEDIKNLVGRGYFDSVVKEADEDFNNYLRNSSVTDLTLDEILKNRNVRLDKWKDIKKQMSKLKAEEIKRLTINELELLHVFSTAVALRDKKFSLFKLFNSTELRMSKYFTQIQQTFDNGEVVINYIEKTFLK